MSIRTDTIDDALDRLQGYTFLDGAGFPVHGPMGAEALVSLGQDAEVAAWVEAYKKLHAPIDPAPNQAPIDADDEASWRSALGDFSRIADWTDLFTRQLLDGPWADVVHRWVPTLLPGYGGALTHGLIRTGHAVRGLSAGSDAGDADVAPSTLRLDELARGLGLWAASYRPVPGQPALDGGRPLAEAVAALPRVAEAITPMEAAMFTRIPELDGFTDAVEALAPTPPDHDPLSDLTAAFCRVIVAHPEVPAPIFVHAVTPAAVARAFLPYMPELTTETLYRHMWPVDAALLAALTRSSRPIDAVLPDPVDPAELVARALDHRDPHVIKFTEACLREHTVTPDPVYLVAAQQILEAAPPWDEE